MNRMFPIIRSLFDSLKVYLFNFRFWLTVLATEQTHVQVSKHFSRLHLVRLLIKVRSRSIVDVEHREKACSHAGQSIQLNYHFHPSAHLPNLCKWRRILNDPREQLYRKVPTRAERWKLVNDKVREFSY